MNAKHYLLPSRKQIICWLTLAGFFLLARIAQAYFPENLTSVDTLIFSVFSAVVLLLIGDAFAAIKMPALHIKRHSGAVLPVNRWTPVHLSITHDFTYPTAVEIFDGIGDGLVSDQQPCIAHLVPQKISELTYRIKALRRGAFNLVQVFYRVQSPLKMWLKQGSLPVHNALKVYPDFSAISAFKLLAREQHTNLLGIKKRRRRGEGADFAQLREYRPGDALRNIHWKATSLRQQLISKEYQDAKDQRLIVLLDTGQRMRAVEDTLTHFDSALNAALLLGFIALHQGDHFALQTFGPIERWVPLQKGTDKLQVVLNSVYDLDAVPAASDFLRAAELINQKQLKRSLIVVLTNLRSEDHNDLIQAISQLKKKHLVLIGDLQETQLQQARAKKIANLDDALLYTALQQFEREHEHSLNTLKNQGALVASVEPGQLAATLANYYLSVKRSGIL
ncbi:MAG TPA: DUF58 domain-containing protein [Cellvibrionaceae bacterium]